MMKIKQPSFLLITLYTLSIIVLSLMPSVPQPIDIDHSDKLEHLVGYALMAGGWLWQYPNYRLRVFFACFSLGLVLEGAQSFVPYRETDVLDLIANTLGAGLGIWVASRYRRSKQA